jgi:hypothetical protein
MDFFAFEEPEEAVNQIVVNLIKGSIGTPFGNVRDVNRESLAKSCLSALSIPGKLWSQAVVAHFLEKIMGDAEMWEATRCGVNHDETYKKLFGNQLRTTYVKVIDVPIIEDAKQKKPIVMKFEVEIGTAGSEEFFKSIGGRSRLIARNTVLGESTVVTMTMDQNHGLADYRKSSWNHAYREAARAHVALILQQAHDKVPDLTLYSAEPITPRNSCVADAPDRASAPLSLPPRCARCARRATGSRAYSPPEASKHT